MLGWSTSGGTDPGQASGTDFAAVSSGTLTIEAGSTAGTLTVTTSEDSLVEDDETLTVTITGTTLPAGVTLGTATATGTIQDNDALAAAVTADASMVVEGDEARFTVTLSGDTPTADVVVSYTVAGTATAAADYTAPSGSLTIPENETTGSITIATRRDTVTEAGETLSR